MRYSSRSRLESTSEGLARVLKIRGGKLLCRSLDQSGHASENVWLEMLQTYLPQRYQASSAHIVDSQGKFSDQIDVVIFDRQYSPFIFKFQGQVIVPAESVYAVFEAKQVINAGQVSYAQDKIQTVRRLTRTSLPIPHAGGTFPPKPLPYILAGLLTFESDWSPALGQPSSLCGPRRTSRPTRGWNGA